MTVERRYSCDLCNLHLRKEELLGVYWDKDRHFIEEAVIKVEHHICMHCLDSLMEIAANKGYCELTKYGDRTENV